MLSRDVTPIRMVPVGDEERTMRLAARLMADGHFVNVAVFPAVPVGRGAVRVMLNNHHTLPDVRAIVEAIARGLGDPSAIAPHSRASFNPFADRDRAGLDAAVVRDGGARAAGERLQRLARQEPELAQHRQADRRAGPIAAVEHLHHDAERRIRRSRSPAALPRRPC